MIELAAVMLAFFVTSALLIALMRVLLRNKP